MSGAINPTRNLRRFFRTDLILGFGLIALGIADLTDAYGYAHRFWLDVLMIGLGSILLLSFAIPAARSRLKK